MKIAALIPAYCPDEKLITLLQELSTNTDYQIFVVDDGNGEKGKEIFDSAKEYSTVLVHEVNRGKGAALKTGISYILENTDCDGVVTLDADGQHTLEDTKKTVTALNENPDALILGGRLFTGKIPLRSRFGNNVTRGVFKLFTGVSLHDTQSGLRAFSRKLMEELRSLEGDRYEYEMNVLLDCAKRKVKIVEVPIETIYIEENKSSHVSPIKDSFKIYKLIFKVGTPTFILFALSSILSFACDYLLFSLFTLLFKFENGVLISNVLARIMSATLNYSLNKLIVFKKKGELAQTLLGYCLLAAGILAANTALLYVFIDIVHINTYVAKLLVEVILFMVSWTVQRFVIFKNKKK